MLFTYFQEYLQKLNPDLWVDTWNRTYPYHKDFPMAGLYLNRKTHIGQLDASVSNSFHIKEKVADRPFTFLMGVPHNFVPEYTIIAINGNKLEKLGYSVGDMNGNSGKFFDTDFINNIRINDSAAIEERVLAKGYKAILSELVRKGFADRSKAQEIFCCDVEPGRTQWPCRYIDLSFSKDL